MHNTSPHLAYLSNLLADAMADRAAVWDRADASTRRAIDWRLGALEAEIDKERRRLDAALSGHGEPAPGP